jgi:magnesium-transporting ATPase (P-type)
MTTDEVVLTGLTSQEAARRLAAEGPNELPTARKRNLVQQAWDVVRERDAWHQGMADLGAAEAVHPAVPLLDSIFDTYPGKDG